ncbi:MAG: bifunctional phosphopantothenoylcysteine decarboxylase/phosphopantothenate--cysteine ligase CoaBC [Actinomycetales bacterium]|nr:bifunctional phosphopantothenoylcysteine decarboxylase/phosphopantothenate--cysteine ligase CoaBC [Actinomycetales bacterium]
MTNQQQLNIVVGVGGGIAAYKVAGLVRLFTEAGHKVQVVPTAASLNFVGAATWEALSGNPVITDLWESVAQVPHVHIGQNADLVVIAPATADLMSRMATGSANDVLTNVLLTATCPIVIAPAMHTEMWLNSATVANVATLRERGVTVIEPAIGRLTGADSGPGRLPEVADIAAVALAAALKHEPDLAGKRVVITAGGTREYLDPVRFISNRSSGKQGIALALAAASRGAQVTLIAANVFEQMPAGISVIKVETGRELAEELFAHSRTADVVIMAAAIADFAPEHTNPTKIKKSADEKVTLELVQTPDLLNGLAHQRDQHGTPKVVVGFAAETGDESGSVLDHARAKLIRKDCDLLIVNEVGHGLGFGTDDNQVIILAKRNATEVAVPRAPKLTIAHAVLDAVVATASN